MALKKISFIGVLAPRLRGERKRGSLTAANFRRRFFKVFLKILFLKRTIIPARNFWQFFSQTNIHQTFIPNFDRFSFFLDNPLKAVKKFPTIFLQINICQEFLRNFDGFSFYIICWNFIKKWLIFYKQILDEMSDIILMSVLFAIFLEANKYAQIFLMKFRRIFSSG